MESETPEFHGQFQSIFTNKEGARVRKKTIGSVPVMTDK
jgi:hypothetical protein